MSVGLASVAERVRAVNRRRTTGVFLIGYPKTGNTWTRFLLGRYLEQRCGLPEPPLFDGYDRFGRCQRACEGPGMHFTHAPLEWRSQTADDLSPERVVRPFRRGSVVLIVRYPVDVIASLWMQQRHRTAQGYDGDLQAFADDPVFGLEKLLRFHRLWEHERDRRRGLHLLRYEDLRADAQGALRDLLRFVGIPMDPAALSAAVDRASFASMRRLELSGAPPRYRSSGASVFATGDPTQADALHVRRGTVGGYRDYLEPAAASAMEARVTAGMPDWYGYRRPPASEEDAGR